MLQKNDGSKIDRKKFPMKTINSNKEIILAGTKRINLFIGQLRYSNLLLTIMEAE